MASVKDVIEGLEILARTAKVPAGLASQGETDTRTAHLNGAGHDVIAGPDAKPSDVEVVRLQKIGWHWDDECECWCCFC